MPVYSERAPIPQQVEHDLQSEGIPCRERSRNSRTGIVREMEADLFLSLATAEQLREWLVDKIEALKKAQKFRDEMTKKVQQKSQKQAQKKAKKRRSNGN